MEWKLNPMEIRILGVLMEKQRSTPEYYPLSLNALVQACNQKSSRYPVVNYSEGEVGHRIKILYDRALINEIISQDRRVPRYDQRLTKLLHLSEPECAILCVLFLRGAQTPGQIKSRTGRLYDFQSLAEVQNTIRLMEEREEFSLVGQLPRIPGTKEHRYDHRFYDESNVDPVLEAEPVHDEAPVKRAMNYEEEISNLKQELAELKAEFRAFKDQF